MIASVAFEASTTLWFRRVSTDLIMDLLFSSGSMMSVVVASRFLGASEAVFISLGVVLVVANFNLLRWKAIRSVSSIMPVDFNTKSDAPFLMASRTSSASLDEVNITTGI